MSAAFSSLELERARSAVADLLGIGLDDARTGLLAEVLERRVATTGDDPGPYLDRLTACPWPRDEIRVLARALTVPETYFFRHQEQFQALAEVVLPDRLRARRGLSPLRLLSAGCASGEEAWSLAIQASEAAPGAPQAALVDAVDINPAVLERAQAARYSPWSLRDVPPEVRDRWFRTDGRELVLAPPSNVRVSFLEQNLVLGRDDADPWPPAAYDVVFCRNVLMYFTVAQAQALVGRFVRALVPGGYLFLGHAENLRGLSPAFELRHTQGTFYYQRKQAAGKRDDPPERPPSSPERAARGAQWSEPVDAGSWMDTVTRSSERIRALRQQSDAGNAPPPAVTVPPVGLAMELLGQERYQEALRQLGQMDAQSLRDPEVSVLRAALLIHSGALAEAELVCRELLSRDDLNAAAHYLLGLCREGRGDAQGAVDQHQIAAHLEPGFAMPRVHLGLLARREGRAEVARRELQRAAELLAREDPSRLILFGGGFGREGLIALCRAELARLEQAS